MSGASNLVKASTLLVLTLQNVSLILVMRYIRTRAGDMFYASTAVVLAEVVKFTVSMLLVLRECGSVSALLTFIAKNTYGDVADCLKISVPAIIYMLQNNVLYVAISNLDAVTYQISYQLKLLTTAFFSVIILRKKLSAMQWASLFCLFVGVAIVQLQTMRVSEKVAVQQRPLVGLIAVVIACVMSGFAGVYFEFMLKNTEKSVWWRNVQLALLGAVFGVVAACVSDGDKLVHNGFFFGYDAWVVAVVLLQSLGGLVVAVVVKYLDNIVKGFATSAAIVIACVFSIFMFSFSPNAKFLLGTGLVMASIYGYSRLGAAAAKQRTQAEEEKLSRELLEQQDIRLARTARS